MCTCSHGCPGSPVQRNFLDKPSRTLRRRTGYNANNWGVHPAESSTWTWHRGFVPTLDRFIFYLDDTLRRYRGPGAHIDWIGCAGATTCKPGYHSLGRAIDITRINLGGGKRIDMNMSWRDDRPMADRRLYLAVVAAARIHSSHVLTAYWRNRSGQWDTSHDNHIHIDNARGHYNGHFNSGEAGPEPLHRGSEADTVLIQLICNFLDNAGLVVDGQFGTLTTEAWRKLRRPARLDIQCLRPFGNYWDMVQFLNLVCVTSCANKRAGAFKAGCSSS